MRKVTKKISFFKKKKLFITYFTKSEVINSDFTLFLGVLLYYFKDIMVQK